MVNFRKLAKFALTGSLAFGLVMAAGTMKADATPPTTKIEYGKQQVEVNASGSKYVFFGVEDKNGNIKTWERIQAASDGKAVIDLSSFSTAKEWKFQAYGDKNVTSEGAPDPAKITVSAVAKKVTAKYNPSGEAGKVIEVKVDGTDVAASKLEFRTQNTTWQDVEQGGNNVIEGNIDKYSLYGTTLILRQKADEGTNGTGGALASKEVKVKITKRANAPKVVLDPVKLTVTIPAKAEWRILDDQFAPIKVTGADTTTGWVSATTAKVILTDAKYKELLTSASDYLFDKAKAKTIEVRTAATDKKPASKVGYITLEKQPVEPTASDFTATVAKDAKGLKATGIKIKNNTDKVLEVAVIDSTIAKGDINKAEKLDVTALKYTKIPASSDKIVIPIKTATKDKKLVIRFAGAKQTKNTSLTLASQLFEHEYTYPEAATALSGASLAQAATAGQTKLTAPTSSKKLGYKVGTQVKNVPLETKAATLGLTEIGSAATKEFSVSKGQYVTVFEYDSTSDIVEKFVSIKVEQSHIKAAD